MNGQRNPEHEGAGLKKSHSIRTRMGADEPAMSIAEVTSRLVFANVSGDPRAVVHAPDARVVQRKGNDAPEHPESPTKSPMRRPLSPRPCSTPGNSLSGSQRSMQSSRGSSDQGASNAIWSHQAESRRKQEDQRLRDAASEVQVRLGVARANIKTTTARLQVFLNSSPCIDVGMASSASSSVVAREAMRSYFVCGVMLAEDDPGPGPVGGGDQDC
jgi:hypothetical protein